MKTITLDRLPLNRLPRDPGPAAWKSILPPAPGYAELESDISADWVIVGAGFAGLSAARRLTQLVGDESIVLLEAGNLADGPAGRNSGFMLDLPHELNSKSYAGGLDEDRRQIRLNRAAIDFAGAMAKEFDMPTQVFDQRGKVTGAASARGERHLDVYQKHLDDLGEAYQTYSRADIQRITGLDFYTLGLFTPGAAMIQPAAYIQTLARGLSRQISLFERSPVIRLDLGDGHRLHTPKGSVRTRNIILAVNGLIQLFGYFPRQLLHVFTYASMTRKLKLDEVAKLGGTTDWEVLPADPMGTTIRRFSDFKGCGDRIVVRNHASLNQSREASAANMKRAARLQDQAFASRFGRLGTIDMEYRWGGRLCLSLNSVPAFGELEKGVFSACCQNGLGTVKGTLAGMMAAEQATGTRSDLLTDYLQHEAPKKLPPEPFLSVGANATMRWKEFQAGIEL
ncbi:MAG: NAD(P)/FAD-dependent oxidoreductase [Gammaproteobacteria bacterium]